MKSECSESSKKDKIYSLSSKYQRVQTLQASSRIKQIEMMQQMNVKTTGDD